MAGPEEYQELFHRWCAGRVPDAARAGLQVGFSTHGNQVTIVQRRPPAFPELDAAWSSTRVAQLRHNDPAKGLWRIYRPSVDPDGGWHRYDHPPAETPEPLLDEIAADPTSLFWG